VRRGSREMFKMKISISDKESVTLGRNKYVIRRNHAQFKFDCLAYENNPHSVLNVLKMKSVIVSYMLSQMSSKPAEQKHVTGIC
jgi:hypothetical protein